MTDQFANAFATIPGRCFHFVTGGVGASTVCREQVVISGHWRDARGKLWLVQACALHLGDFAEIESEGEKFVPYDWVNDEARRSVKGAGIAVVKNADQGKDSQRTPR
jgi:hypothetical protein